MAGASCPSSSRRRTYPGYIFDLDGTIYLGDRLLPGVRDLIAELRHRNSRLLFLSNNPTRDAQMYVGKLASLGIDVARGEILNTITTMTAWLVENAASKRIFVVGEAPLQKAIAAAGLESCDEPSLIDVVVASYDRGFTYRKLQIAFDAISTYQRAKLVATNLDPFCPMPGGRGEPDTYAIVAAIEACTGTRCSVNTGKPDAIMVETALRRIGLHAGDCLMIGDRLGTDIAMGVTAGMDTALVLTGETQRADLPASTIQPSLVLDRIDQLLVGV